MYERKSLPKEKEEGEDISTVDLRTGYKLSMYRNTDGSNYFMISYVPRQPFVQDGTPGTRSIR